MKMIINFSNEELFAKASLMLSEYEKTSEVKLSEEEAKEFIRVSIKEITKPKFR
jgi:hypothetical protein